MMRKLNHLLAFVLVVGLVLTTAYLISAQQEGGRRQRPGQFQRRQMVPEAMMQRRVEQVMGQLNLSDDEVAVLKPKIETFLLSRLMQMREMQDMIADLQKAIRSEDDARIEEKLEFVKAKRKEHEQKAKTLEDELRVLLTLKQEAILTVSGIVNGGSSGSFFGRPGGMRGRMEGFNPGRMGGSPNVGQDAPDFSLKTLDGKKTITLSSFKGKPVVLVFGSYT